MEKQMITVAVFINAPLKEVWQYWTAPKHIIKWNQPSEEWLTSRVVNDLRVGGRFLFMMEARDGSAGFAFEGVYDAVHDLQQISFTLTDGRKTINQFVPSGTGTTLTETFEPEAGLPMLEQRNFCASVLENFRHYVEKQQ